MNPVLQTAITQAIHDAVKDRFEGRHWWPEEQWACYDYDYRVVELDQPYEFLLRVTPKPDYEEEPVGEGELLKIKVTRLR